MYAHRVGTPQSHDILVFEEVDDSILVDVSTTRDKVRVTGVKPALLSQKTTHLTNYSYLIG